MLHSKRSEERETEHHTRRSVSAETPIRIPVPGQPTTETGEALPSRRLHPVYPERQVTEAEKYEEEQAKSLTRLREKQAKDRANDYVERQKKIILARRSGQEPLRSERKTQSARIPTVIGTT